MKEACKAAGLTKKAVEYYERQGLITPRVLDNGYRAYDEAAIARLKEIAVLRRCGLGAEDIGPVLASADKAALLRGFRARLSSQARRLREADECLVRLIESYTPLRLWEEARTSGRVLDRLEEAFPGAYGAFLRAHFGAFLDVEADTPDKLRAMDEIFDYLDEVPEFLPQTLARRLEETLPDAEDFALDVR